jgi:hypothetical protein
MGLGTVLGPVVGLGLPVLVLPVLRVVPDVCSAGRRCAAFGAAASGLLVLLSLGASVLPVCPAMPGSVGTGSSELGRLIL